MKPIKNFFESKYFPPVTYLITLVCWYFQLQTPAIIYSALAIALTIISGAKRINIVTVVFAGLINYRATSYETNFWPLLLAGIFILPLAVYDLVRKKINFNNPLFIALVFCFLASLFSLINITGEFLIYGVIGILQAFAYCYLFLYFWNKKEKDDYRRIGENAVYLSLAIALQIIIFLIQYKGDVLGKRIKLGWSASNSLAMVYLLLIPLAFYAYLDTGKWHLLLILGIDIAALFLTLSKGAYLAFGILLLPFFVYISRHVKNKSQFRKGILILFSAVLIAVGIMFLIPGIRAGLIGYLKQMAERGWFNDQARIKIYRYGLDVFKEFPLFGSGAYTAKPYLIEGGFRAELKHYHNYVIQNLATLGICGLLAFGYFIFQIFNQARKHPYNIAVIFAASAMLIHGLVDNTWHNPLIMIIMLIYLAFLVCPKEID